MTSQVARFAWYRFRATFRHRRGGYLGIILLVGLIGGLAIGAVAGARRTDSSFPTYLASTNPSNVMALTAFDDPQLGQHTGYNPRLNKAIAHLGLVAHFGVAAIFDGNIDLNGITGVHLHANPGETPPTIEGGLDGYYTNIDRLSLVKGRFANPNRANEAVMNAQAAEELGLHIGSVIHIPIYTDAQSTSPTYNGLPHRVVTVQLVGEVISSTSVVESDISRLGSAIVVFSPALTRELAPCCAYVSGVGLRIAGGDANVSRVLAEVARMSLIARLGLNSGPSPATELTDAQRAIKPEAIALAVFGGIAGIATVLVAGLFVARMVQSDADEKRVLRALGADRAVLLSDALSGPLAASVVGSLLAVAVAVGLSPLMPLGPVRPVYPYRGVSFDWTVLGFGFLTLVVLVGSVAIYVARRELNRLVSPQIHGTPFLPTVASAARYPVPVSTGLRFALGPGRGAGGAPVRSAIFGAAIAVIALITTVTFGTSLNNLLSHPALYGWNWNYAIFSGFAGEEDLPNHQIASFLNADRDVEAWSGVNFAGATLDGQAVRVISEEPGARVAPPMLSGHGLDASDQIVLGASTLAALHRHLGEFVTFSAARSRSRRLLIVGTATMPTITKGFEMGTGALVATSDFPAPLLNTQDNAIPGPNAVFVRVRPGTEPSVAYRSLAEVLRRVNALRGASGSAGGVVRLLRPAEIVNYRAMGTTPAVLGGALSAGALIALGLTLVASVRGRRHDLALLKTLGLTRRQLATVIASQSSAAAIIGLVVGVPIGIVLGRILWDAFAHEIFAVPMPIVPVIPIVLIAIGALVVANIVAAVPGRMAARTPSARLLRAE